MRVAQIGLGNWGKNILRNLVEMNEIAIGCDTDQRIIDHFASLYPDVSFTTSVDSVFSDDTIGAVVISAPAVTHNGLVRRALLSGKHVFVEKPLALTFSEGKELVVLAEKMGRILMVGHVLQYHPAVRKLRELIRGGALGKLHYVVSNRLNIGKLRTEENVLWSFAPHDISVMLSFVGEEPVKAQAFGGDYLTRGIYDVTLSTLEFKNGVKGHIFVSWLHPFKEQRLAVIGSKGMAVFDDQAEDKLTLYKHDITWQDGKFPVAKKTDGEVVPIEPGEPLRLEIEHFLSSCRNETTPITDGNEALRVLKVLNALEGSLRSADAAAGRGVTTEIIEYEGSLSELDSLAFALPEEVVRGEGV